MIRRTPASPASANELHLLQRLLALGLLLSSCNAASAGLQSPARASSKKSRPPEVMNWAGAEARKTEPHTAPTTRRPQPASHARRDALVQLELGEQKSAWVSIPRTDKRPQALMVIAHGAGGNARTHCQLWRSIVGEQGFLLCLRGKRMFPSRNTNQSAGYFYTGHNALEQELRLAVTALLRHYGEQVDSSGPTYAGYSQGASMGARFLPDSGVAFRNVILVEGGMGKYQEWNLRRAQKLRKRGGRQLVLVCGRLRCATRARSTASLLRKGGIRTNVIHATGVGHTYDGAMKPYLQQAAVWLLHADDRWSKVGQKTPL